MVKLKYIIRYLVSEYPNKDELSKARLTKMVYLADWYNALLYEKQLTDIKWYFDHYGPYVVDVYKEVIEDSKLSIVNTENRYGSSKQLILMKENYRDIFLKGRLGREITEVLDKVITDTKLLYWNEFIKYIYSSYPIKNSSRYTYLDLKGLAKQCELEGKNF